MLKIRFVILFGVILGGALSFAAVKSRPRPETRELKKAAAQPEQGRKISSEN